jgi:hypothetical protein
MMEARQMDKLAIDRVLKMAIWFAQAPSWDEAGAGAGTTKSQKLHGGCDAGRPVAAATSPSASIYENDSGQLRDTLMPNVNVKTRPLLQD